MLAESETICEMLLRVLSYSVCCCERIFSPRFDFTRFGTISTRMDFKEDRREALSANHAPRP